MALPMLPAAEETAYYLNPKIPAVALISKGVPFPSGTWRWLANATALAWHVEEMLAEMFPALQGKVIPFVTLMSEFDVSEFEQSLQNR